VFNLETEELGISAKTVSRSSAASIGDFGPRWSRAIFALKTRLSVPRMA
jgi:hypothetical protein